MTRTSRPRKRYILFRSTKKLAEVDRSKVIQMLGQEGPNARSRTVVWLDKGLIVKSTLDEVADLRERLNGADINGSRLSSVRISGAIGKLKKLARGGSVEEFGQVLQR